jgi:hypothetical protein
MYYLAQLKKKNALSHFNARFQVNTVLLKSSGMSRHAIG